MKCKFIREDIAVAPGVPAWKTDGKVETRKVMCNGRMQDRVFWQRGAVIEHPMAFRLVQQGVALPADDECQAACHRTEAQLTAAQLAYERVSRGIHPDDFALYDAGIIAGYNDDGSYKPGPNAEQHPDVFAEPDDDEDDDE